MVFLRKFTLVIAEILLLLLITLLLASPETLVGISERLFAVDLTLRVVVVIVIDILIFLAIISQLRGGTRYSGPQLIVQAGDSNTTVTTESVRQGIIKAMLDIDAIENVKCDVKGKRGEALITMEVISSRDDINIPNKQKEIDRAIKRVVVKQMGVKLSKPAVISIRLASDAPSEPVEQTNTAPSPVVQPLVTSQVTDDPDPQVTTSSQPPASLENLSGLEKEVAPSDIPESENVSDSLVPPSDEQLEPLEPEEK